MFVVVTVMLNNNGMKFCTVHEPLVAPASATHGS
jgi:hypothetical protein